MDSLWFTPNKDQSSHIKKNNINHTHNKNDNNNNNKDDFPLLELTGIQLSIHNRDEMEKLSVMNVTQPSLYKKNIPTFGGVNDLRLGSTNIQSGKNCTDNFGICNLPYIAFSYLYEDQILGTADSVCFFCSRILTNYDDPRRNLILETPDIQRASVLSKIGRKISYCGYPPWLSHLVPPRILTRLSEEDYIYKYGCGTRQPWTQINAPKLRMECFYNPTPPNKELETSYRKNKINNKPHDDLNVSCISNNISVSQVAGGNNKRKRAKSPINNKSKQPKQKNKKKRKGRRPSKRYSSDNEDEEVEEDEIEEEEDLDELDHVESNNLEELEDEEDEDDAEKSNDENEEEEEEEEGVENEGQVVEEEEEEEEEEEDEEANGEEGEKNDEEDEEDDDEEFMKNLKDHERELLKTSQHYNANMDSETIDRVYRSFKIWKAMPVKDKATMITPMPFFSNRVMFNTHNNIRNEDLKYFGYKEHPRKFWLSYIIISCNRVAQNNGESSSGNDAAKKRVSFLTRQEKEIVKLCLDIEKIKQSIRKQLKRENSNLSILPKDLNIIHDYICKNVDFSFDDHPNNNTHNDNNNNNNNNNDSFLTSSASLSHKELQYEEEDVASLVDYLKLYPTFNACEDDDIDIGAINQNKLNSKLSQLQYEINSFLKNYPSTIHLPASYKARDLNRTGIITFLQGKEGFIRRYGQGKWIDDSGRSLISPNTAQDIGESILPLAMAKKWTKAYICTSINTKELMKYVKRTTYPKALFIERRDGTFVDLEHADRQNIQLELLDIVKIQLKNGDIVLTNRPPSLHALNIQASKVFVLTSKRHDCDKYTFKPHVSLSETFAFDYDGDEMSEFNIQTSGANCEAYHMMWSKQNPMTAQSGRPLQVVKLDGPISLFKATAFFTFISERIYIDCIGSLRYWNQLKIKEPSVMVRNPLTKLWDRNLARWTGKQMISEILPKMSFNPESLNCFDMRIEKTFSSFQQEVDYLKQVKLNFIQDKYFLINDGEIVSGRITSLIIGNKTNGLFHNIFLRFGKTIFYNLISDIQRLSNTNLDNCGSTASTDHLLFPFDKEMERMINKFIYYMNHEKLLKIDLNASQQTQQMVEAKSCQLAAEFRTFVGKILKCYYENTKNAVINQTFEIIKSGAKASDLHYCQMTAMFGQSLVEGERLKSAYHNATTPFYQPGTRTFQSQGFIKGNFVKGLSLSDCNLLVQETRESLIAPLDICKCGYLFRQTGLSCLNCKTTFDNLIMDENGRVVSFGFANGIHPCYRIPNAMPHLNMENHDLEKLIDSTKLFKQNSVSPQEWDSMKLEYATILKDRIDLLKSKLTFATESFSTDVFLPIPINSFLSKYIQFERRWRQGTGVYRIYNVEISDPKILKERISVTMLTQLLDRFCIHLFESYFPQTTIPFQHLELHAALRYYLRSKNILFHFQFRYSTVKLLLGEIERSYRVSLFSTGLPVGILGSQSNSETGTQNVLSTSHAIGSHSYASSRVLSSEELFNGTAKNSTIIFLKPCFEDHIEKCKQMIEPLFLKDIAHFEVCQVDLPAFVRNEKFEAFCQANQNIVESYPKNANKILQKNFQKQLTGLEHYYHNNNKNNHNHDKDEKEMESIRNYFLLFDTKKIKKCYQYHLRIVICAKKARRSGLTLQEIITKCQKCFRVQYGHYWIYNQSALYEDLSSSSSSSEKDEWVLRLFFEIKTNNVMDQFLAKDKRQFQDINIMLLSLGNYILNRVMVHGIPKIYNVQEGRVRVTELDPIKNIPVTRQCKVLITDGTNFIRTLILPFTDQKLTNSTSLKDMESCLGIDAANQAFQKFAQQTSDSQSISINPAYYKMFADFKTRLGKIINFQRHDLNKLEDVGWLQKCAFEELSRVLVNCSLQNELDPLLGITSCIDVGKKAPIGPELAQPLPISQQEALMEQWDSSRKQIMKLLHSDSEMIKEPFSNPELFDCLHKIRCDEFFVKYVYTNMNHIKQLNSTTNTTLPNYTIQKIKNKLMDHYVFYSNSSNEYKQKFKHEKIIECWFQTPPPHQQFNNNHFAFIPKPIIIMSTNNIVNNNNNNPNIVLLMKGDEEKKKIVIEEKKTSSSEFVINVNNNNNEPIVQIPSFEEQKKLALSKIYERFATDDVLQKQFNSFLSKRRDQFLKSKVTLNNNNNNENAMDIDD